MSEKGSEQKLEKGSEHLLSDKTESLEGLGQRQEKEISRAEKEHGEHEQVESKRSTAEGLAKTAEEVSNVEDEPSKAGAHPLIASLQIKKTAWTRQMTRTRKKLKVPDRAFSKVIHNPIVDKPSEFIGKTVARPQGMLWGSLVAFIGTSALLWITNYNGYEFNYLLVILLFVGGALVGTAIEGLAYAFRRKK